MPDTERRPDSPANRSREDVITVAISDKDLEGFTLVSAHKPEKTTGVSLAQIPPALVKLLEGEAPKALKDPEAYELILRVPVRHAENADQPTKDEALKTAIGTVKQLALYATAWGKGQEPKLYITKIPNRKDDKDAPVARLKVQEWEKVSKDNRPGRR